MAEKENVDITQETTLQAPNLKKQPPRYTHENKKGTQKINKPEMGPILSFGKNRESKANAKNFPEGDNGVSLNSLILNSQTIPCFVAVEPQLQGFNSHL
jgi:hypothetical protein